MTWRRQSLLLVILFASLTSCGRTSQPPALQFVDIGVDEDSHPAGLAVIVENSGGGPAQLKSAVANVSWNYLITGKVPTNQLPAAFEHELNPTGPAELAAGGRQTLMFDLVWKTAADAPPMLAIIHATLTLNFNEGQAVQTIPVTFLIRSQPEIALRQGLREPNRELADKIKSLPGWKSPAAHALADANTNAMHLIRRRSRY